jgi:hypothetical protein
MRKHSIKEHNKKKLLDNELFMSAQLQSWFGEKRQRYWAVRCGETAEAADVEDSEAEENDGEDDVLAATQAIREDIQRWEEEAQGRRVTMLERAPAQEIDPWLQYTGWETVLRRSKHDLMMTAKYARDPDVEETDLSRLIRAWGLIVERCLDTLAEMDQKDALKWWASPKNEVASQRPFELPQSSHTIVKYSKVWERFICYFMRTAPLTRWDDETETGVVYTQQQWNCIVKIREDLEEEVVEEEEEDDDDEEDDRPTFADPVVTSLMNVVLLMIQQDTSNSGEYQSPMMHYLAVRGIHPETRGLMSTFHYTPILAGMLWMNRLLMLELTLPKDPWPEMGLVSKRNINNIPEVIQHVRRKHLCEGSYSPTATILSQLARGKSFNKEHQSPANIHWSSDEQTIHYLGKPVELMKLRDMCHTLTAELQTMLQALTMHTTMPTIDLKRIVDTMSHSAGFRNTAYSFVDHPENHQVCRKHEYLLEMAQQQVRSKLKSMTWRLLRKNNETNQFEWNARQVQAYLSKERQFLRKLMVAMHITGGQPARGPELGSIKVSNSLYSARNIYVFNGRMCFLTVYDKARNRRGNNEYVLRCLPPAMSQILAQYVVYVRPFVRVLDKRESEYLFGDANGPWAGEELTRGLSQTSTQMLGVRLTTQSYRQVAVGIATRKLMKASQSWDKDESEDEGSAFAEGDDADELEQDTLRHVMVRQAGHGRRVAQAHYAIDGAFLHRLQPELLTVYEKASMEWHKLLELDGKSSTKGHRREASHQLMARPAKRERGEVDVRARVCRGLQRIFHRKDAQPLSEAQALALELVHNPSENIPLVIVLPTSAGKSALFFSVAALVEQQTVIVVVPFTALVDDVVARGRAAGLDVAEWLDERSVLGVCQLVVVSADRAVQGEFLHYAKGLQLRHQLAHVFFDECHVAFTDTSYRERLRELWMLRYLECPFTGLTATLMVELEHVLRRQLCIENAKIFRQSTTRKTIRYQVRDSGKQPLLPQVVKFIEEVGPLASGKRGVVYVRSYQAGNKLSAELECPFYRARADDKGELLKEWSCGGGGWIVATGALGTGINIEGIEWVVHAGRPYGLTSFVQQSGRGGRSGEISNSVIIAAVDNTQPRNKHMTECSVEAVDEDAMTAYIQGQECGRKVLHHYFDRSVEGVVGADCRSTDSILCEICQTSAGSTVSTRCATGGALISRRLQCEWAADAEVTRVMDRLARADCFFCGLVFMTYEHDHEYETWPEAGEVECSMSEYRVWRQGIKLGEPQDCFLCGLPRDICHRFDRETGHAQRSGGLAHQGQCDYPGMMQPGIYIMHQMGVLHGIVKCIGFRGDPKEEVWEWLGQWAEGFGSRWRSNWWRTWKAMCDQYGGFVAAEDGSNVYEEDSV